jgi:hypothetical protein
LYLGYIILHGCLTTPGWERLGRGFEDGFNLEYVTGAASVEYSNDACRQIAEFGFTLNPGAWWRSQNRNRWRGLNTPSNYQRTAAPRIRIAALLKRSAPVRAGMAACSSGVWQTDWEDATAAFFAPCIRTDRAWRCFAPGPVKNDARNRLQAARRHMEAGGLDILRCCLAEEF